jgi:hypothetical protein
VSCSKQPLIGFVGFGYSWPSVDCFGLWSVAFDGASFRNRSDFHPCRFLLLLCEEVRKVYMFFFSTMVIKAFEHCLTGGFLADYSVFGGQLVLRLPSGVV